jgi:hypothetical protein
MLYDKKRLYLQKLNRDLLQETCVLEELTTRRKTLLADFQSRGLLSAPSPVGSGTGEKGEKGEKGHIKTLSLGQGLGSGSYSSMDEQEEEQELLHILSTMIAGQAVSLADKSPSHASIATISEDDKFRFSDLAFETRQVEAHIEAITRQLDIYNTGAPSIIFLIIPSQTQILPIFCLKPPLLCLFSHPKCIFFSYFCLKSFIPHPTDIDELSLRMEEYSRNGSNKSLVTNSLAIPVSSADGLLNSWDTIGKDVINGLSPSQCQVLLWDVIEEVLHIYTLYTLSPLYTLCTLYTL